MLGQADDATCVGGSAADRVEEWPLQLMPATSHVTQTDREPGGAVTAEGGRGDVVVEPERERGVLKVAESPMGPARVGS